MCTTNDNISWMPLCQQKEWYFKVEKTVVILCIFTYKKQKKDMPEKGKNRKIRKYILNGIILCMFWRNAFCVIKVVKICTQKIEYYFVHVLDDIWYVFSLWIVI